MDGQQTLEQFYSDEEPENFESQQEDMKIYLNKINKKIDTLIEVWKKAENMMSRMGDFKVLMDLAQKRRETLNAHCFDEYGAIEFKKFSEQKQKEILYSVSKQNNAQLYQKTPVTDFLRSEIAKSSQQQ